MTRRARDSDYLLLGVTPHASAAELLSAFRKRARELHPDVRPQDPGADARFRDLAEAYQAAVESAGARPPVDEPVVVRAEPPRARPARQEPPIRAAPAVFRPWPRGRGAS